MKINYTIENEKIKLQHFDATGGQNEFIKLYDDRLPDISFLHIKGSIRNKTYSAFHAALEKGIILSIQIIPQNSRFEFESYNNVSVNFAPEVESLQLMTTNISFRHGYEHPGLINRLDIFIPTDKIDALVPANTMEYLSKYKILNLSDNANKFSSSIKKSLAKLIKELEKPASKSLCTYFERFIQSATLYHF